MEKITKILMIGSSYCYYFCDELYAIAHADGVELKVANLYISGGMIKQHYEQLTKNEPVYWYIINDKNGRERRIDYTIEQALSAEDWDVVTNQESYDPRYSLTSPKHEPETREYAKKMFDYVKNRFPKAKHYWHQVWSKEVGFMGAPTQYNRETNFKDVPEEGQVRTTEKQTQDYEVILNNSLRVCQENDVPRIPTGDAWQLARADARIGDHMCMPKDKTHDDEEGGGQYLNACVWYEVLTGNSCIGNTFRPEYDLPEEKIIALQECAHKAVAGVYGEDFAK